MAENRPEAPPPPDLEAIARWLDDAYRRDFKRVPVSPEIAADISLLLERAQNADKRRQ